MRSLRSLLAFYFILSIVFAVICYCCVSNDSSSESFKFHTKRKSLINDAIQNYNSKNKESIETILALKPNDLVYRYVNLPLDMRYGSNAIPLTVATLLTNGPILELGMGAFSTPLLHNIAADTNRNIVSIDTDYEWLYKFVIYNKTSNHKLFHLNNDDLDTFGLSKKWGLVLVDHILHQKRSQNVIDFSKKAQIVVLHDTEKAQENFYSYEKNNIRNYYKYACKYSLFSDSFKNNYISTLILSNFINLSKLKYIFSKISTEFGHVACDLDY